MYRGYDAAGLERKRRTAKARSEKFIAAGLNSQGKQRQKRGRPFGPLKVRVRLVPSTPRQKRSCEACRKDFPAFPSSQKRFCSYACFVKSGGPFWSGLASARAKMKYGTRKDANHREVMDELKKHCPVFDLSDVGMGVPDGIAWVQGRWVLLDVKNPNTRYGRNGLNPVQKKWIGQMGGGPIYLIYTADEARQFALGNFEGIKSEGGMLSEEEAIAAVTHFEG